MSKLTKNILAILLILSLTVSNTVPFAIAQEATEGTEQTQTTATETTTEPTTQPEQPQQTEQASTEQPASPTPTVEQAQTTNNTQTAQQSNDDNDDEVDDPEDIESDAARQARKEARRAERLASGYTEEGDVNRTSSETSASVLGANYVQNQGSNTGDSTIKTGDATSTATVANTGNNNLASGPSASIGPGGGAQVVNSGNGTNSNNNGSATIGNNNNTNQNNSANVNTNLNQSATTGSNDNSNNTGGDSSIETGDANVTGTLITSVNTNVDGIMVSEFNIADDHVGDILLDFAANCVSGCGGSTSVANTENGSGSDNNASVDTTNNNVTFQNNDANIGSDLVLSADSGNNTASRNTGGDSNITTGDANVSANALTFANNNIAGDVVYAVVNIFGDLVGDILFPEEAMNACCSSDVTAANTGNGSYSNNDANIDIENTDNLFQYNDADIANNLVFDAQTGNNDSSGNTGGDTTIDTGNTNVEANVLNVVNNNLAGGNMWLVLVNEAGNWIGKLMGAPEGTNYAGSQGTDFTVDENGFITASNNGNGSNSDNSANVSETNTNTTTQINNADVANNLNLSANTGGNQTSDNTGGNSKIKTGDANIVANLVNFVNNNISGNGKLFVTVVNVFGSWMGDFVSPGQQQREDSPANQNQPTVGGPSTQTASNNSNKQTTVVTPQPSASLPKTTTVAAVTQSAGLLAWNGGNSGSNTSENTQVAGAQTALVKNASYDASKFLAGDDNKKIRINLAWLVLILPMVVIAYSTKRFLLPKLSLKKS